MALSLATLLAVAMLLAATPAAVARQLLQQTLAGEGGAAQGRRARLEPCMGEAACPQPLRGREPGLTQPPPSVAGKAILIHADIRGQPSQR